MPSYLTACTGIDALTRGEAYDIVASSPVVDVHLQRIRLIWQSARCHCESNNVAARKYVSGFAGQDWHFPMLA